MSHNPSEGDEPPILSTVSHGAEDKEARRTKQNVATISNLRGADHLLKMEELIASNRATVDSLTQTDVMILEVMDPLGIPPTIKEKIKGVNMTITMRIAAAEQRPSRVMEVQGNLFKAPRNAVLMRTAMQHIQAGQANRPSDACNTQGYWGKGIAAEFRDRVCTSYSEA